MVFSYSGNYLLLQLPILQNSEYRHYSEPDQSTFILQHPIKYHFTTISHFSQEFFSYGVWQPIAFCVLEFLYLCSSPGRGSDQLHRADGGNMFLWKVRWLSPHLCSVTSQKPEFFVASLSEPQIWEVKTCLRRITFWTSFHVSWSILTLLDLQPLQLLLCDSCPWFNIFILQVCTGCQCLNGIAGWHGLTLYSDSALLYQPVHRTLKDRANVTGSPVGGGGYLTLCSHI